MSIFGYMGPGDEGKEVNGQREGGEGLVGDKGGGGGK